MNTLQTVTNAGVLTLSQGITEDLYTRFIAFIDASPKTVETYTRALRQFINWLQLQGINKPTREDILAYREEIRATHKPTTVQNYIVAVRLFFQWTAQEGLYSNVADKIKGAKLDRMHKRDYLTSTQAKAVLDGIERNTIQGLRDYAIMTLMLIGALRDIEVTRAKIGDLRTAGDSAALYLQGKGRDEKTEYVKLPTQLEQAIRAYLNALGTVDSKQPLFVSTSNNNKGKGLTTRTISGIVKERLRQAGFNSERLTAHSLRHTAGTLNILNGATVEETQQFLRHKDINTTMIYVHQVDREKSKCEQRIADAIF